MRPVLHLPNPKHAPGAHYHVPRIHAPQNSPLRCAPHRELAYLLQRGHTAHASEAPRVDGDECGFAGVDGPDNEPPVEFLVAEDNAVVGQVEDDDPEARACDGWVVRGDPDSGDEIG